MPIDTDSNPKAQAWYRLRAAIESGTLAIPSDAWVTRAIARMRSLQASGRPLLVGIDLAGPRRVSVC